MEPSPTGMPITPGKPAPAIRVRKEIIAIVAVLGALIVGGVIWGLTRQTAATAAASITDANVQPATTAGRLIMPPRRPTQIQQPVKPGFFPASTPGEIDAEGRIPSTVNGRDQFARHQYGQGQYNVPPVQYANPVPLPVKSQLEIERENAWKQEQAAMTAPATVASWSTAVQGNGAQGSPGAAQGLQLSAAPTATTLEAANPDHLDSFVEAGKAASKHTYMVGARVKPASPYQIEAGWKIPAILEEELNSDLPGEMTALVRTNVYDTATGRYLLIPQGARLVGNYESKIRYGQNAIAVSFSRLVYPDASSQVIDGMAGHSASGSAGFSDRVDRHYTRLLTSGLLLSAFNAGAAISTNRGNNSTLAYPTATQSAGTAVGTQMSQLGIEVTRQNLSVAPTIKIRPGYRFDIQVSKDMIFEGPYKPVQ